MDNRLRRIVRQVLTVSLPVLALVMVLALVNGAPNISAAFSDPEPIRLGQLSQPQAQANDKKVDPIKAVRDKQKKEQQDTFAQAVLDSQMTGDELAGLANARTFMTLLDDTETLGIAVPTEWSDIDLGSWIYQGQEVGVFIAASTDLGGFDSNLSAPGVFIGASSVLLDGYSEQDLVKLEDKRLQSIDNKCKGKAKAVYADAFFEGEYYPYAGCGKQADHYYVTAISTPADRSYMILLRINLPDESSLAAVTKIFDTFQVIGAPGKDEHHEHE